MKFKYCRKNFGDELNHIIWPHFFSKIDARQNEVFLGIGSIIGMFYFDEYSKQKVHVFSSGYALGKPETYGEIPKLGKNYNIICVRGPKTAKILNLPPSKGLLDGAYLLRELNIPEPKKIKGKIGLILNHESSDKFEWEKLAFDLDLLWIDPEENVYTIIDKIRSCDKIITEALHGGIVADLYGIPWVPIKIYKHINIFKWEDWWESLSLDQVKFIDLPRVFHNIQIQNNIYHRVRIKFLTNIFSFLYDRIINSFNLYIFKRKISNIIKKNDGNLSERSLMNTKIDEMLLRLNAFIKSNKID